MPKRTIDLKFALAGVFFAMSALLSPLKAQDSTKVQDMEDLEPVDEVVDGMETLPIDPSFFSDLPDAVIIDRLKCLEGDGAIKFSYNPKIKGFIDYFTIKNRRYLEVMERRKNLYFPIFEACLKKYNMPEQLKYLSIVESGLNPTAVSHAGAAGLWQFMPSTGKIYKLHQDFYMDERLDPYMATEAACKYLKQLYNMFHDWELALASYNCGPGNVRRAIRRSGYKETFWGIYRHLPAETRSYVPQFIAVAYVMNYLDEYQIDRDSIQYPMAFDTVYFSETVDLGKLSSALNICKEDLKTLNPGLKQEIVPAYLNYALRIPADVVPLFNENRVAIADSCKIPETEVVAFVEKYKSVRHTYTVRRGDYLGKIADRYNVSISSLRKWNGIRGSRIAIGQRLVIYKQEKVRIQVKPTSSDIEVVKIAKPKIDKDAETTKHTVQRGENLNGIAAQYGVSVSQLKDWNNLSGSLIKVGQSLQIKASDKDGLVNKITPRVYYVQPGDTLWSISKKYNGISVEDIKKRNNLKSETIKPGMKLVIG